MNSFLRTSCRSNIRWLGALLTIAAFCGLSAHAANWYINAAVGTSGNGQSWSTAWKQPGNVNWGSVQPGDTIWIAGGNYSSGFTTMKNGTASNWIQIKRATSGDAAATGSAGWSASYDSQVVVSAGDGFWFDTANTGSYLYVDGRSTNGIRLQFPGNSFGSSAVFFSAGGMHDIVFTNIDMAGPGGSTPYNYQGDCSVIGLRPAINGGGAVYNVTVASSELHGGPNLVYNLGNNHHFTFLRCKFYDNGSANSSIHANMVYTAGGNYEWTFAYCEFYNWQVEGINLYQQTSHPHYFYGCVFRDPMTSGARCFWLANEGGSPTGPIFLYNNTFIGVNITLNESRASMAAAGSQARNNIYWNANFWSGSSITDSDYNFSSGSTAGANSISAGSNPFVNEAANDFRIVSTIGAKFPRDKGISLPAPYNRTADGNTRGSDGAFDMGAFEFGGGGPSTNAAISVTPGSLDFGTIASGTTRELSLTVRNIGGGTLAGSVNVSSPFSVVAGGSYSLSSNQSQTVTIRYNPAAAGSHVQVATFSGGGGTTASLNGSAFAIIQGLSFESFAGTVSSPFSVNTSGGYISQSSETSVTAGGQAVYGVTIPTSGSYVIQVNVNAPNDSANSLFVNFDGQPNDPTMIWDIPVTSGFVSRTVSWRGGGTFDNPQHVPAVFNLTAGTHQLIIRGREGGVQIGRITIAPAGSVPPSPPQNLRVTASL